MEEPLDGIDLVRLKMRLGTHSLAADRARTANEDSYCRSCGEVETLHHFLFECLDYEELRKELRKELGELGVESELVRALKGGEGMEESEKVALVLSMSWPKEVAETLTHFLTECWGSRSKNVTRIREWEEQVLERRAHKHAHAEEAKKLKKAEAARKAARA